jgi:hypothetical protein
MVVEDGVHVGMPYNGLAPTITGDAGSRGRVSLCPGVLPTKRHPAAEGYVARLLDVDVGHEPE